MLLGVPLRKTEKPRIHFFSCKFFENKIGIIHSAIILKKFL